MVSSMADSDAEKTVLELLPKLLKERAGFRYMVEDILSDRLVVKDEIKMVVDEIKVLREDFNRAMEENAREHRDMNQRIGAADNKAGDFYTHYYAREALEMFQAKYHVVPEVRKKEKVDSDHEIDVILSNGDVWVIETSRTVSEKDVQRAVDKAAQVGSSPEYQGKVVHAIVAGPELRPGVEEKAREMGVVVLSL